MSFLLDTSYLIEVILGGPKNKEAAPSLLDHAQVAISMISLAELYEGAYLRANTQAIIDDLHQQLRRYAVLPLTDDVCNYFAELRAYLRRRGELISDFDLLIAGTAIANDLTLLTRNLKDFKRLPDLRVSAG